MTPRPHNPKEIEEKTMPPDIRQLLNYNVGYILNLIGTLRRWARTQSRSRGTEAGLTTLEVAIIAAGLAGLATAVVLAITQAVNAHKSQIK
jgi:NADPH-dependent 2,4-dienoyl-CoA reductase/sulfur reductase-like enzyme